MQGEKKGYRDCSDQMVSGLMEVLSLAIAGYHSKMGPDIADIESLYEALHILRPNKVKLELFDGLIKIKKGLFGEAIASLQQLLGKEDFAYAKGMLAYCLYMKGDISWNGLADEALAQDSSDDVIKLLRVIKQVDASNRGASLEEMWLEPDSAQSSGSVGNSHQAANSCTYSEHHKTQAATSQQAANEPLVKPKSVTTQAPSTNPLPEHALRL